MFEDKLRIADVNYTGTLEIWDRKKGETEFVKILEKKNLVVTLGLNLTRDRLFTSSASYIQYGAVGSGTTAPTVSDTDLETIIDSRVAFSTVTTSVDGEATLEWSYDFNEGIGDHSEAGLFTASSSGVMLCRVTFAAKTKDNTTERIYRWRVSFTGA